MPPSVKLCENATFKNELSEIFHRFVFFWFVFFFLNSCFKGYF